MDDVARASERTVNDLFLSYIAQPSDINEHLQFMHDVCIETDAKVVVELGVRSGVSTAAFLAAMEHTGGVVWSCDINMHRVVPEIAEHPRWEFWWGSDLELVDDAPDCDVLFIDTSHAYQHTIEELDAYASKAQLILLHDTQLEQPEQVGPQPPFPVRKAALEWLDRNPGWDWQEFTHNNGLGVMRRRT